MSSIGATPFSLRPWPTGDKKPKNLGDFIARINADKGGFRFINEEQLRQSIKAQENGQVDTSSPDSGSESDAEPDKSKTIGEAREEICRRIDTAHQHAMMALDTVSLLLSKEMPVQGGSTISPTLRDLVGIGTLGATKLSKSNITEERRRDDRAVATGWRMMGINKMVDSVVEAADKLEKEIDLETKYWADVMDISEGGWAVGPLPHDPHTLGVRFGFAEAAAEFRNQSMAPLRRNDDGTVRLQYGRVGGGSQRIRVRFEKGGDVVDSSLLPARPSDDAPLQERVLEARNTIFAQELWHEMNREATTLLSFGVHADETRILFTPDQKSDTRIVITLEDLAESPVRPVLNIPTERTTEFEAFLKFSAERSCSRLHFLLCAAHRQNYTKRITQGLSPAPPFPPQQGPSRGNPNNPQAQSQLSQPSTPYPILRPFVARHKFNRTHVILVHFLADMKILLQRAGISTAEWSVNLPPQTLADAVIAVANASSTQPANVTKAAAALSHLQQLTDLSAELTITPDARISMKGRVHMIPFIGSQFLISLPKVSDAGKTDGKGEPSAGIKGDGEDDSEAQKSPSAPNLLEDAYPPSLEPYPNIEEAIYYLRHATSRALAEAVGDAAAQRLGRDDIDWFEALDRPAITDGREDREVKLAIELDGDTRPVLVAEARLGADEVAAKTQRWTWRAGVVADGDQSESLEDLVVKMLGGEETGTSA